MTDFIISLMSAAQEGLEKKRRKHYSEKFKTNALTYKQEHR